MKNSALLKSSLAKKYWMALTGLFLCLFLVGHLLGNLQLLGEFNQETAEKFDLYAKFMTTNPAVKILSYLTYISILFHAIDGFMLAFQNSKARKQNYAYSKPEKNSNWTSRYMAVLGSVILIFIIMHMYHFWARMHFSDMPVYKVKGEEIKGLYLIVVAFFTHPQYGMVATLIYIVAMIALAFHLSHGLKAAFQSLGANHPKYNALIKNFALAYSVLVPLGFIVIAAYIGFGLTEHHDEAVKAIEMLTK